MTTQSYLKSFVFVLLFIIATILSCSKNNKQDTKEQSTITDTITNIPKAAVDSSQLVLVKYNNEEGSYYGKKEYQHFTEWFNKLNKNVVHDPDVAQELYLAEKFSDDRRIDKVSGGPKFYYLYAHLILKRNGVAEHAKMREKLLGIFGRINAIHANLHSDGSYIYFSFQRTAIAAYAEYALYYFINYIAKEKSGSYDVSKQRALYLQGLRQKVHDELGESEKIPHSQYAVLSDKEKEEHKQLTIKLIDELGELIETTADLRYAQEFHYSHY